ncbi:MAG TPA: hypothetical protein VH370_17465 [Humisphaera sp.]|jgi:hypothetical protein|nr:hypothetical protein [Humisphaera sp.]
MSYIDDLADSLIKVVSTACGGHETAFAGYAANREFWVAEAIHVLEVINGYQQRFERMSEASMAHREPNLIDWSNDPITAQSSNAGDLSRARRRVRDAMRRFLSRCVKIAPGSLDAVMEDCRTLGIPTPI